MATGVVDILPYPAPFCTIPRTGHKKGGCQLVAIPSGQSWGLLGLDRHRATALINLNMAAILKSPPFKIAGAVFRAPAGVTRLSKCRAFTSNPPVLHTITRWIGSSVKSLRDLSL